MNGGSSRIRGPRIRTALVGSILALAAVVSTRGDAQPRPGPTGPTGPTGPNVPTPGASSSVSPEARDQAAKLNTEAQDLYRRGEYRAAIRKLEQARTLDPDAKDLHYNLGLVHEKLGELDQAIVAFKRVLELETDAKERDRVMGVIRRLEGARRDLQARNAAAASASATAPAATATPARSAASSEPTVETPPPPARGRLDGWVYGTGGLALAGVAAGTFLGIRALTLKPSSPKTGHGTTYSDLHADALNAHTTAIGADVSFGVAILAGGLATYLYFSRTTDPVRVGVIPTPRGGAGSLEVSF